MDKKNITITESSARELLKRMKSEPTYKEIKDEDIDCSDIPEMTEEQLRQFKPRFPKTKRKP